MSVIYKPTPEELKALREKAGLSVEELAGKVGKRPGFPNPFKLFWERMIPRIESGENGLEIGKDGTMLTFTSLPLESILYRRWT